MARRVELRHVSTQFQNCMTSTLGRSLVVAGLCVLPGIAGAQRSTRLDSTALARRLASVCRPKPEAGRAQCLRDSLSTMARAGRVREAMAALGALPLLDPGIRRDDHVYAHAIGISAESSGHSVAEIFTQCNVAFQSGCYHVVIQSYFDRLHEVDSASVAGLCAPFRSDESQRWILFQCVHGMGHGLTMFYAHDLPRGLAGCDLLPNQWERHSCYGGVFMENIVNATMPDHPTHALGQHSMEDMHADAVHARASPASTNGAGGEPFRALNPADLLYPCSVMAERYVRACYEMQTSVMLHLNGGRFDDAARNCERAPEAMRTLCHQSLGRDVSSRTGQNYAESIRLCSLATERFRPWCYVGLVKNFVDLNGRFTDGLRFCKVVPREDDKLKCYEAVGEEIAALVPESVNRRIACGGTDAPYAEACLYGARMLASPPETLRAITAAAAR